VKVRKPAMIIESPRINLLFNTVAREKKERKQKQMNTTKKKKEKKRRLGHE